MLLSLGGGLLAAASWLDLGTASGSGYRESLPAGDTFEGGVFIAAGLAFVVAGVVVWGRHPDRHSRIVGAASGVGAIGVLWLAVAAALAVGREGGRLGDDVDVALGLGMYLAVAGAGLALVGAGVSVLGPRDRARRPPSGFEGRRPGDPWGPAPPAPEPERREYEPPASRDAPPWSSETSGAGEAWGEPAEREEEEGPGHGV